jgi:hypothetical protein
VTPISVIVRGLQAWREIKASIFDVFCSWERCAAEISGNLSAGQVFLVSQMRQAKQSGFAVSGFTSEVAVG